ncbi:pep-cterm sorting domain-containing protein [Anaeramoeba flamelloides]|uniref:Pep-cterm sorting domain-containing protein n=1 Tax=Anaeramoeba flamelloides TaxID=1746091 RepID=A0AAV7YWP6_9EUKA|nr:pep-cterm sorting domain-containing protein [Anaeramoeba flamelloides]
MTTYSLPFSEMFEEYFNSPEFSDLLFYVGDPTETFYAHRIILASSSEFFSQSLYITNPDLSLMRAEFTLKGVQPQVFKEYLKFCYTGALNPKSKNLQALRKLSIQFQTPTLLNLCNRFQSIPTTISAFSIPVPLSKPVFYNTEHSEEEKNPNNSTNGSKKKNVGNLNLDLKKQTTILNQEQEQQNLSTQKLDDNNNQIIEKEKEIGKVNEKNENKHEIMIENVQGNETEKEIEIEIEKNENKHEDKIENVEGNKMEKQKIQEKEQKIEQKIEQEKDKEKEKEQEQESQVYYQESQEKLFHYFKPVRKIRIAIITGERDISYLQNVSNLILKSDTIESVKVFRGSTETPTFNELKQFDAAFIYTSDEPFHDSVAIGDLLVRYVKDGGGCVIASINCLDSSDDKQIDGGIINKRFLPIEKSPALINKKSRLNKKKILQNHPIMKNVSNFDGGSYSFRIETKTINEGAKIIATWEDGCILAAEMSSRHAQIAGRIVVLNFWPPSSEIDKNCWDSKSDGHLLISNSLEYVSFKLNNEFKC